MKKTLFILIAFVLTVSVNAQWYANQYGVTNMNELNKEQLVLSLDQAVKIKKAGVITTVISSIALITGAVMYSKGLNEIYDTYDTGKATSGLGLMTVGGIGVAVGIPLIISGAQRSNIIRVHLAKFDPLSFGVGFTLTF